MASHIPFEPLDIARSAGVPLADVAIKLRVTPDWLRKLAKDPRHRRRVFVAELETLLERERLALSLESLVPGGRL
jgi:hypothetical protein